MNVLFILCIILFTSCVQPNAKNPGLIEAPDSVRDRALVYAYQYKDAGAIYEWGGQDPLPRTIKVDCSGLVIRCYQYACQDFGYTLPFIDETAAGLERYCKYVSFEHLAPGDLLFMGDGCVTHVALFIKNENGYIYFIDATQKGDINGVSVRSYPVGDSKFISSGRLFIVSYP